MLSGCRPGEKGSVCPFFRAQAAHPIAGLTWLSAGPQLSLLFVHEVRVVQFHDMGVTIHAAPQEILTRPMKSQASPAVEGW